MTPPNLSMLFIMVCFWVAYWLVKRFLIRPVGEVVAERTRRIDGAEAQYTAKHEESVRATERIEAELDEASREAGRIRADHRQRALQERQQQLDAARATADGRLRGALETLESEAETAREELRRRASGLARQLAGRLLEREVG
jgi:F-type H+-transporting ATPase subunit b